MFSIKRFRNEGVGGTYPPNRQHYKQALLFGKRGATQGIKPTPTQHHAPRVLHSSGILANMCLQPSALGHL